MSRFTLLGILLAAVLLPLRAAPQSPQPAPAERYDLVVYGGTPPGIACAVRAAREGLSVLLVSPWPHLGGALSNGLTTMDTLYNGARAPLYDELRDAIHDHYRVTYGRRSEQFHASLPGQPKVKVEAKVFEKIVTGLVEREKTITVVRGYYPVGARCDAAQLHSTTFRQMDGSQEFTVAGFAFADCSYEGDLLAVARVPYRVGRESQSEFNEEHAGRIFMTEPRWPPPAGVDPESIAKFRRINVVQYYRWYQIIRPATTGAADKSVQAYNLRTVLTCDPANRVPFEKPDGYDPEALRRRIGRDINWPLDTTPKVNQPNLKTYINLPEVVGIQHAYPEGDWATRRRIVEEHANLTRQLVYFMQNDPSVAAEVQAKWREWGWPRDEFADNGHLPYEIYVREARRIEGRGHVFNENDARWAPGLRRSPLYADAIGITEWFLDSHACTPEHVPGSMFEGEILLNHVTVPGQVSLTTILPKGVDNLLVPVCVSSSHIGWGALRLEPTWMPLAEAAAHTVVLARKQRVAPARINPDSLVQLLAQRRFLLTFFNDVEVDPREPWWTAVQYFGTKGFFGTFDAQPLAVLTSAMAESWAASAVELASNSDIDANARARQSLAAEEAGGAPLIAEEFVGVLTRHFRQAKLPAPPADILRQVQIAPDIRLSRGNACRILFALRRR